MFIGWRKSKLFVCIAAWVLVVLGGCPEPETLDPPSLAPQPNSGDTHWLRMVHITDPQIADEESPARAVRADGIIGVSWRPQESYSAHVLDATLQRINAIHGLGKGAGRPVDFVIVTGDLVELAQSNELGWFLDVMDGAVVTADSGDLDGVLREGDVADNPKLGFQATGLARDIPWYTTYGNHDGLAVGNFGITRTHPDPTHWYAPLISPVSYVLGLHLIDPSLSALVPTLGKSPAIILGSDDPADPTTLRLPLKNLLAGPIAPDASRQFLSRRLFVEAHFATQSLPLGHGFPSESLVDGRVRYSVMPKAGVPVRLVVMNTVASNPLPTLPFFYGVMRREQFDNFVRPEIEEAQANGEFVILASHHPSSDFRLPYPGDTVTTAEFRDYVSSQPNIIGHFVGHTHRHNVSLIPGTFPYLEIETASIIDFPQEGRVIDVFYNKGTGAIRLESTVFGHGENPTRLSAEGLRRATLDPGRSKSFDEDSGKYLFDDYMDESYLNKVSLWPATPPLDDRYGDPEDRDFSVTLRR